MKFSPAKIRTDRNIAENNLYRPDLIKSRAGRDQNQPIVSGRAKLWAGF